MHNVLGQQCTSFSCCSYCIVCMMYANVLYFSFNEKTTEWLEMLFILFHLLSVAPLGVWQLPFQQPWITVFNCFLQLGRILNISRQTSKSILLYFNPTCGAFDTAGASTMLNASYIFSQLVQVLERKTAVWEG